jgi:hypothetical protein
VCECAGGFRAPRPNADRASAGHHVPASREGGLGSRRAGGDQARTATNGRQLRVTLSGPGTLRVGSRRFKVRRPGTINVPLRLTAAQDEQLADGLVTTVALTMTFVPSAGETTHRLEKVRLRS